MGIKQWIRRVLNGGMNTDDDVRAVQPPYPITDYLDSENTRLAAINGGFYNSRISVKGNLEEVNEFLPAGDNKIVGVYEDREGQTIIIFNYNSEGEHGIYQYMANNVWTELMRGEELDFNIYRKITGIDVIDDLLYWAEGRENPVSKEIEGNPPRVINLVKANDYQKRRVYNVYFNEADILNTEITSWTATINLFNEGVAFPPEIVVYPTGSTLKEWIIDLADKINAETGQLTAVGCECHLELTFTPQGKYTLDFDLLKFIGVDDTVSLTLAVAENFYPTPVREGYISRIKYAPLEVPKCVFKNDPDFQQNFVAKKYFQFCTQYIYDNSEYSCISPISKLVFDQNLCGTDNEFSPHNYVEIDFYDARLNNEDALCLVKKVNIYVRYGYLGEWRLVKTLERCDFNIVSNIGFDDSIRKNIFKFYNDGSYPVQALELVQADSFVPLIATSQAFAQNRGYLGATLEGYDNIECVDASSEVSYVAPCTVETGTLTGRIYLRNPSDGVVWAGKDYQPILGHNAAFYGSVASAGAIDPGTIADNFKQTLPLTGFVVFPTDDPTNYSLSEQNIPDGFSLVESASLGNGVIDNTLTAAVDIRDAMDDGLIYSTYTLTLPVGKHIIRVASNLLAEDEVGYYAFPGDLWQFTSLPVKTIGTTGGDVTSFYHEAIVEITAGVTLSMDIELYDLTPIGTDEHSVLAGYLLDGEGESEKVDLISFPLVERAAIEVVSITGGATVLVDGWGGLGLTDHNGFFFKLLAGTSPISGSGRIQAIGADSTEAVAPDDTFYVGDFNLVFTDPDTLTSATAFDVLTAGREDIIFYNHYEAFSNNCRTNIEGVVVNSDGLEISGVSVFCHLTSRQATTDGDGAYSILVYCDMEIAGDNTRQGRLFFKTGSNCCLDYPDGENLIAVVTPFTPNANYSIYFPFTVSDFILDIDGFDIEHWWKHRNNVKLGIVYMDVAGRRGRVQEITPLFIPFYTDEGGNTGQPVVKWSIFYTPPVWAVKYQIVVQKNPYYNRYLQFIVGEVIYVKLWDYTTVPPTAIPTTFEAGDATEISFSLIPIVNFQQENTGSILGFIPEKGDRITFMKDSEGAWFTEFFDYEISSRGVGTFEDPTAAIIKFNSSLPEIAAGTLVELYTPKLKVETDFYFEIGEVMDIGDIGLSTRYHKKGFEGQNQTDLLPATGFIYDGDTFVRNRKMFVLDGTEPNYYDESVEDMYIYDDDADSLQYSYGTPNIADPDYMQYFYKARIRFSGLYNTDGNKLFNGLSTFIQAAYGDADQMFGVIQKLVRVGEQYEILAIQSHKVQPIYVNKALLFEYNTFTNGTLTANDNPLNFGIPFKSPWGTQHPESIVTDGNSVWGYDMFETLMWHHNSADLIPISDIYNYKKKIDELSNTLRLYDQDRVHINGSIDRDFREVVWAFEFVSALSPIGGGDDDPIPDDGGGDGEVIQARIGGDDLADFQPVTVVFSITRDKWETRYTWYPEAMTPLGGDRFFAFKSGRMWEQNINPIACNFMGVQFKAKIVVPITEFPQLIKDWYSIREKANKVWAAIEIVIPPTSRNPNGMRSRITKNNFSNFEGDLWAQFFKDMSDPSFVSETEALQRGRELKGDVMIITFENSDTVEAYINEIDINFTPSQETM